MEKIIRKFQEEGIYTKDSFESLESKLGFGVNAFVKKPDGSIKIVYGGKASLHCISIQILSAKNKKLELKIPKYRTPLTLKPEKVSVPIALKDLTTGEIYIPDEGYKKGINEDKYFILPYTKKEMENITSLKDEYENKKKGLEQVCEHFGLNAKDYGYKETSIGRQIMYETFKYIEEMEHLDDDESKIHKCCFTGPINYIQKAIMTDTYYYDVNSFFPFLMTHEDFKFPLMRFIGLRDINAKIENCLEICKLEILGEHKYFARSSDDYYCTYHIELLDMLKIPYKRIGNVKYVYEEPMKGSVLFGSLNDMYDIKKSGNKYVKPVLNSIWGSLSMEKTYEIKIADVKEWQMDDVMSWNVHTGRAEMKGGTRTFRHCTARLKVFLLAFYRLYLVKNILLPLEKKGHEVYKIATDGFISNATPEEMSNIYPMGKNLGELKIEKTFEGEHQILNKKKIQKL